MPIVIANPFVEPPNGNDSFTMLLVHSDTTNGSTTAIDGSVGGVDSPHTMTMESGAQHSTARSKFGASSIRVAGGTQNVSGVDSDDFALGGSDFALEAWINFNTLSLNKALISQYSSGTANDRSYTFSYNRDSNKLQFTYSPNGTTALVLDSGNNSFNATVNTWYHFAVTRSGSALRFFVDGIQKGTTKTITTTIHNCSDAVRIGAIKFDGAIWTPNTADAYFDEVRISVGTPRWTSNFTPETAPYTP